jgi:tRNA (guanine37-N1)-methyltransferase
MQIDIISVVPQLMESFLNHSILKRAQEKNLLTINLVNLRDYGIGNYKQVDDYQYGGDAGMVLMCEPLSNAIESLISKNGAYDEIIFLCPDGKVYDQKAANFLSLKNRILLICGHYKGIDERIREKYVTLEISIGDYVLSGGELAAAVLVDSIGRLIPGVLNNETSALTDSFQDNLLSPPVYTRPEIWDDQKVPAILLSGNAKEIDKWKYEASLNRTKERRPDLFDK